MVKIIESWSIAPRVRQVTDMDNSNYKELMLAVGFTAGNNKFQIVTSDNG